jgi:hypothetical protein
MDCLNRIVSWLGCNFFYILVADHNFHSTCIEFDRKKKVIATNTDFILSVLCFCCRDGEPVEGGQTPFLLHPWLRDEVREEECLRQITEALLLILVPTAYSRCDSHRHLLREIISTSGQWFLCNNATSCGGLYIFDIFCF